MSRFVPLLLLAQTLASAQTVSFEQLQSWVAGHNIAAVRSLGRAALPALVRMYEAGDESFKTRAAQTF